MSTPHIPERFLRQIWQQQRFTTDSLQTADGKPVRILSPGTSNNDGGPDFLNACIRVGNVTLRGDVELHHDAAEWPAHNHDLDPHYNRVILHVVLTADAITRPAQTASRRAIPLLVLHPFLDATLRVAWMQSILDEREERRRTLPCHPYNDPVPVEVISQWLNHLAHERLELKIRRFEERLTQLIDESKLVMREPYPRYYGNPDEIPVPQKQYTRRDYASKQLWEQLLYEGIMECMGYAKNCSPFLSLAQSVRLRFLKEHDVRDTQTMMALLFGAGGLLPSSRSLADRESRAYLLALKRRWRELRPQHKGGILQEGDWLFFRLRPVNFPTARLASMCFLLPSLGAEDSFRTLIRTMKAEILSHDTRLQILRNQFRIQPEGFWKSHYHFKEYRGKAGIAIGDARLHDIIVNAIVPIVLVYARVFRDSVVRSTVLSFLAWLSPGQDNIIERTLQSELLKQKMRLGSALQQQGAVQLFKFYCVPRRCRECEIGKLTPLGR